MIYYCYDQVDLSQYHIINNLVLFAYKNKLINFCAGIIGMVWWVLWMFLVAETPAVHPRISDIERRYINQCLGNLEEVTKKRRVFLLTAFVQIFLKRGLN